MKKDESDGSTGSGTDTDVAATWQQVLGVIAIGLLAITITLAVAGIMAVLFATGQSVYAGLLFIGYVTLVLGLNVLVRRSGHGKQHR